MRKNAMIEVVLYSASWSAWSGCGLVCLFSVLAEAECRWRHIGWATCEHPCRPSIFSPLPHTLRVPCILIKMKDMLSHRIQPLRITTTSLLCRKHQICGRREIPTAPPPCFPSNVNHTHHQPLSPTRTFETHPPELAPRLRLHPDAVTTADSATTGGGVPGTSLKCTGHMQPR